MAAQIGYYDTLKSVAGKVFTYLASITLDGTDGKTITCTQDTSLDEAVAMSSKAPKASPVFTGIIGNTGGQIAFPATAVPSADPNTLDDYEEGTWTPTIAFDGSSVGVTYATGHGGHYTKIGNTVFARCRFYLTSKGTSVGSAKVGGLPFTINAGATYYCPVPVSYAESMTGLTGVVGGYGVENTTTAQLVQSAADTYPPLTDAVFTNTSSMMIPIIYVI